MDITHYYTQLVEHNWYFTFSDDPIVYKQGHEDLGSLKLIAHESTKHRALYEAFRSHYFSGPAWNTEQTPLPPRP